MKPNILVVDDEKHTRDGLELALEDEFEVFCASSAKQAIAALDQEDFEVVLTDLRMPGDSGMNVIDHCLRHSSKPLCIILKWPTVDLSQGLNLVTQSTRQRRCSNVM
jgi:two-component system response regulator AtoC